jgi:hypothetical protein
VPIVIKIKAVVLDPERDNVAVALANLESGEMIHLKYVSVTLQEKIPYQHKFSITHIGIEEKIIKVGEVIGKATENIMPGCHVHIHNMKGLRAKVEK